MFTQLMFTPPRFYYTSVILSLQFTSIPHIVILVDSLY